MELTYANHNYHIYSDGKSIIVATATYAGKTYRGVAKCAPEDEFNYEQGAALAAARCAQKIAKARLAHFQARVKDADIWVKNCQDYSNAMREHLKDATCEIDLISRDLQNLTKDLA